MKKILCGAVAAIALVGITAPAAAQTNERHYAATIPILGIPSLTQENPGPFFTGLWDGARNLFNVGTRYTAKTTAPNNTGTIEDEVTVVFQLSGEVQKDCSFYSGNNSSARDIDFGVIGIRGGDNENVNSAFEMTGNATADIETLTAGCNFNNEVSITKTNGNLGLVNAAAGSYDTNQFQANIPYSVRADWTGVAIGAPTTGSGQFLVVPTNVATVAPKQQGAWRSAMQITITAPAVTNKGLVAGLYEGQTTLKLTAL